MAPWWERQGSHLSFPFAKHLWKPCWVPGWVLGVGQMEWKRTWALFWRSSQTRMETSHKDLHSIIQQVQAKGARPPTLLLYPSKLILWLLHVCTFHSPPTSNPSHISPLYPHPMLANSYSSFRFQLRCHFFQKKLLLTSQTREGGPFHAPMIPLNSPLPLLWHFS